MKRFIYVVVMALGMLSMSSQCANAQFSGLLNRARQIGNEVKRATDERAAVSSHKKAVKEYESLVDAAIKAIKTKEVSYFTIVDRVEELRVAAIEADQDYSEIRGKIWNFLESEGISTAKKQDGSRSYFVQNNSTEAEGEEELTMEQIVQRELEALKGFKKEEYDAELDRRYQENRQREQAIRERNAEAEQLSPTAAQSGDDIFKGKTPSIRSASHEWKDLKGGLLGSVDSRGFCYHGRNEVCQVTENGDILVNRKPWGKVTEEALRYNIYVYEGINKDQPKLIGTIESGGNGKVSWDYSLVGFVDIIEDRQGKKICDNAGNTHRVHRAVAILLYDKIR